MLKRSLIVLVAVALSFPLTALAGYLTHVVLQRGFVSSPRIVSWSLAPLICFPVGAIVGLTIRPSKVAVFFSILAMTPVYLMGIVDTANGGTFTSRGLSNSDLLLWAAVAAALVSWGRRRLSPQGAQ